MSGERALTSRRREAGLICALCGAPIPTPPAPPTRRGYGARERKCETCEPRPFLVTVNAKGRLTPNVDLSVTFQDQASGGAIGPWLLLDARKQLDVILRWGRVPASEIAELDYDIRRWSNATARLRLTELDRAGLAARGRGCRWNGYELSRLRDAGRMPLRAMFRHFPA